MKVDANIKIIKGEAEMDRIYNIDYVAVSMNLAIRVLYIVSSIKVGEGRKRVFSRRLNVPISTGVEQHLTDHNFYNFLVRGELQMCL